MQSEQITALEQIALKTVKLLGKINPDRKYKLIVAEKKKKKIQVEQSAALEPSNKDLDQNVEIENTEDSTQEIDPWAEPPHTTTQQ